MIIQQQGGAVSPVMRRPLPAASLEPPATELYGLVLVGGRSRRMGRDKAVLCYSGKPQAVAAYDLLARFCHQVFLSCRHDQAAQYGLRQIHDVVENIGPMGGMLAAFQTHPDKAWLVLACDFPFVTAATLANLIARRDAVGLATAYRSAHDGKPEPLCAIYEPEVAAPLQGFVARAEYSPRAALTALHVQLLDLPDAQALDNVNDPHEFEIARATLLKP
jgi:molybdopterin-guanine dinucleotide biosynthesis protein A